MRIVINGGGKVGSFLARVMVKNGHDVVLIERRPEVCEKVALEVPEALIIQGDGCDVRYQEDAGVERSDVFVSVTGDDDDNLVACQIAQGVFEIPRVIARVNNPKNEEIFTAMGIEAVSSTTVIAKLIEEEVSIGEMITLQTLKKGRLALVEVELPQDQCIVCDQPVKDLRLPEDCVLVSIIRNNEVIIPKGETTLQKGDSIIALTNVDKEKELKERLLG